MRYRPFGRSAAAVSCVSLALTDRPMRSDDRIKLIYAALEAGINTFELQSRDPAVATALGEALRVVKREMVFVTIRVGWGRDSSGRRIPDLSAAGLTGAIENAIVRTGLGHLDVAVLELTEGEVVADEVMALLRGLRSEGKARMLGVAGTDAADKWIDGGDFDVLATAFNVHSGWRERNRLARAGQHSMSVIGCDYMPFGRRKEDERTVLAPARNLVGRLSGKGDRTDHRPQGPYEFLKRTQGWTPEEICLAFALTEPALATVQTRTSNVEALQGLAAVVERDMPAGLAAQIEMARFSAHVASGAA